MKKIDNLCLASGPWQLIVLAAALHTRDKLSKGLLASSAQLVITYKPDQANLMEWMKAHAQLLYPWSDVVSIDQTTIECDPQIWPQPIKTLTERVRNAVGIDRAVNIWVDYLPALINRLFLEAYPTAHVMIYEDGLALYYHYVMESQEISRRFLPWRRWKALLKGTWRVQCQSHRLLTYTIPPFYSKRIDAIWHILGDVLPIPSISKGRPMKIDHEVLREQLACIRNVMSGYIPHAQIQKEVILLPQYFSAWGYMSSEAEVGLYEEVVDNLIEAGYSVLWKDHPRETRPLGSIIAHRFTSNFRIAQMPKEVPIDVFMAEGGWMACISACSSSLYYARYLHHIPAYTFAASALARISGPTDPALETVREQFADYRDLLQAI